MRVLFTVQPSTGHLHPLVPVARALSHAGHDVAVCSASSFRGEVEAFGLAHLDAGLDWVTADHSTWTAFPADAAARSRVRQVRGYRVRRHHRRSHGLRHPRHCTRVASGRHRA